MEWSIVALRQYAVFTGRARRKEYWCFALFCVVAILVLSLIDIATGTFSQAASLGLLSGIFTLVIAVPSISVAVRRLHDTGRSGWWILISLIPLFGTIAILVLLALEGTPGANQYGESPK